MCLAACRRIGLKRSTDRCRSLKLMSDTSLSPPKQMIQTFSLLMLMMVCGLLLCKEPKQEGLQDRWSSCSSSKERFSLFVDVTDLLPREILIWFSHRNPRATVSMKYLHWGQPWKSQGDEARENPYRGQPRLSSLLVILLSGRLFKPRALLKRSLPFAPSKQ